MKPLAIVGAILVILAALAVMLAARAMQPGISLADATLVPMGEGFALIVQIENPGAPDRLVEMSTSAVGQLMAAGALFSGGLPIPAGAKPELSMDGAHGMLTDLEGAAKEGRLVPVTLRFQKAGAVTTRARILGPSEMDHGREYRVRAGEDAPTLAITAEKTEAGWRIRIDTENFTFSREAADGPHQPGIGHGHLYVNGLKLGRVYAREVTVGALPAGDHEFRVTLNTNDHRTYVTRGRPVTDAVRVLDVGSD